MKNVIYAYIYFHFETDPPIWFVKAHCFRHPFMVLPVSLNCTWTLCYSAPPAFCRRPHAWMPYSTDNKGRPDSDCTHWSPIDGRMRFLHRKYLHKRQMRCRASPAYCRCREKLQWQLKLINCIYFNEFAFHFYVWYVTYTRIWRMAPNLPNMSYISSEVILYGKLRTYRSRFTSGGNRICNNK